MKLTNRARKDPLDAAVGLPAPHHSVDARVVDFGAAFVIAFDWQHPLTSHIERLQDVIEDLVQRQRRWRSASATTQVWQDKFLKLRFAQFRRNRLPAWVTRHSLSPEIWTLTDLPSPITNPIPARLTDKFDDPEKLASSCLSNTLISEATLRPFGAAFILSQRERPPTIAANVDSSGLQREASASVPGKCPRGCRRSVGKRTLYDGQL